MLGPKHKRYVKLENIFSPRSPLEFLGFSLVGVIINLLSGAHPAGFIGVVVLFLCWWILDVWRSKNLSKQLGFSITKKSPKAAKGLILLLSPYSPQSMALKDEQKLKPLITKILTMPHDTLSEADFNDIDLFNSNLLPQIKAVEYHWEQSTLDDVWLISSESYENVRGSEETAQILEKYLRFHYGKVLNIHSQGLVVKDWDYKTLWQLGEDIFRRSDYKEQAIVVDITGGTKMMSVALAMVCIPPNRQMQYMDSQRDWQGNPLPKGEMKPVVIDINPFLYPFLED
ncbi:hypothetical protein BZZ01_20015 [Nostocales cyanobacterium HT-58-2]|nr:hypothetical protein BZZ01_20015 [Nostocales cyanobacterium HT-58-2]